MATYQFPKALNLAIQPYMIFRSFTWSMTGKKNQDITSVQSFVDSIILPIPVNGVVDSMTHNWNEGVGLNATNFREVLQRSVLAKTSDAFGDLGKYIGAQKGVVFNDYSSLAFSGTDFRQFSFDFTMIPRNQEESNTINEIVKSFKRNSLPEYNEWKISYPNFWNVLVKFPDDSDLVKIKNCVVNSLTCNYFADGVPTVFQTGSPQKIDLSIGITELLKLDRRDYA
jgi:hypothetical protein